jgi:membrane protein implicated in regulation of membrane protease activity
MYLVVIGWLYVALMMAAAEALHPDGTVLGATFTFLLYGLGPAALVAYLLGTPARRRARKATELAEWQAMQAAQAAQAGTLAEPAPLSATQPDQR